MLFYCLKCENNVESKSLTIAKINKGKTMLLSKCEVRDSKKSRFIKEWGATGLSSSLGIRTPLSKIVLVDPILF